MKTDWSEAEIARTIAEVKRRSVTDPEFRSLALADARAAIRSVNPRPVPANVTVVFVEDEGQANNPSTSIPEFVVVLPEAANRTDELSDTELEDVAGGGSGQIVIRS